MQIYETLSWNRQVALHKRGKTEFLSRFS